MHYILQWTLKLLHCTCAEDFASSVVPAAKRTKSESKVQVKDNKKKEKENDNSSDNKAGQCRCFAANGLIFSLGGSQLVSLLLCLFG